VLDVRRRREKPTDLFRAENNGEATRLADPTASARSRRFSVTLKKNRRAVALTLTVGTLVPIDANHN
jgi:hypothetical protein